MASERIEDSGKRKAAADGQGHRRPRMAAQESQDPDTLVAQIEATREDLAETLDAIAERVSPKRVAKRGADRMKAVAASARVVASEKAAIAKEVVSEKAATAKVTVSEKAAIAKEVVSEKAATAKETVSEKAATTKSAVSERTSGGTAAPAAVLDSDPAVASGLPPVGSVEVAGPSSVVPSSTWAAPRASAVPKEAIAGVVAALVALWLLRRHRRR